MILVCDVGGGTTDFSLIGPPKREGSLDAAARRRRRPHPARRRQHGPGAGLRGARQAGPARHAARRRAVPRPGPQLPAGPRSGCSAIRALEAEPVVVLGRGSSLIGGTIQHELTAQRGRDDPAGGLLPDRRARATIRSSAAGRSARDGPALRRRPGDHAAPGGVSGPPAATGDWRGPAGGVADGGAVQRRRVQGASRCAQQVLRRAALVERQAERARAAARRSLDLAVARGAAYYGLVRRGRGIRIRGGAAALVLRRHRERDAGGARHAAADEGAVRRAVRHGGRHRGRPARPGVRPGRRRAGGVPLPGLDRPQADQPGEQVEDWSGELARRSRRWKRSLRGRRRREGGTIIPVWLHSRVTEVGTLELWCVARDDERRWKLEFNMRDAETTELRIEIGIERRNGFVYGVPWMTTNQS